MEENNEVIVDNGNEVDLNNNETITHEYFKDYKYFNEADMNVIKENIDSFDINKLTEENTAKFSRNELMFLKELDDNKSYDKFKNYLDKQSEPAPEEKLIAGKFKTMEELVAAYEDLEKGKTSETPEQTQDVFSKYKSNVETPAFDVVEMGKNFVENNNTLDEKSIEPIVKLLVEQGGLAPEHVKDIISNYEAGLRYNNNSEQYKQIENDRKAEQFITDVAGNKEDYNNVVTWVADNVSKDQYLASKVEQYNKFLETDNSEMAAMIFKDFKHLFDNQPKAKTNVSGTRSGANEFSSFGIKSNRDMLNIRNSAKYKSDPVYAKSVESAYDQLIMSGQVRH